MAIQVFKISACVSCGKLCFSFSILFTLDLCLYIQSVSLVGYGWVLVFVFFVFLSPHSDKLYFLIGIFSPFICNMLNTY